MKKLLIILFLFIIIVGHNLDYTLPDMVAHFQAEEMEEAQAQIVLGQGEEVTFEAIEFLEDMDLDEEDILTDLSFFSTDTLGLFYEKLDIVNNKGDNETLNISLWVLEPVSQEELDYIDQRIWDYLYSFEEEALELTFSGWLSQGRIEDIVSQAMKSGSYHSAIIYRIDHSLNYSYDSSGGVETQLEVNRQNHHDQEQEDSVIDYVEATINDLDLRNEALSDVDRIRSVHDHIIYNAAYGLPSDEGYQADRSGRDVDTLYDVSIHSPFAITEYGRGVCQSYATLFQKFCDQLEIPCQFVLGTRNNRGLESHAWNKVQLDEIWYNIDLTWNDPILGQEPNPLFSGAERDQYFLKSDQTFEQDHSFETGFEYPAPYDYE